MTARNLPLDPHDSSTSLYFFKKNTALLEKMVPLVETQLGNKIDEKEEQ